MIGWERIQRGKANPKRWALSLERNVETDNEPRASGVRESQSPGAMTEKAPSPKDARTHGMNRTDESDDPADREREGKDRPPQRQSEKVLESISSEEVEFEGVKEMYSWVSSA